MKLRRCFANFFRFFDTGYLSRHLIWYLVFVVLMSVLFFSTTASQPEFVLKWSFDAFDKDYWPYVQYWEETPELSSVELVTQYPPVASGRIPIDEAVAAATLTSHPYGYYQYGERIVQAVSEAEGYSQARTQELQEAVAARITAAMQRVRPFVFVVFAAFILLLATWWVLVDLLIAACRRRRQDFTQDG